MKLNWENRFNTGVRSIDLQHQELVQIINALDSLEMTVATEKSLKQLLVQLNHYVIFHFNHEEDLMHRHFIPMEKRSSHLDQHANFQKQIEVATKTLLAASDPNAKRVLVDFLQHWLLEHIMVADMEVARHIKLK